MFARSPIEVLLLCTVVIEILKEMAGIKSCKRSGGMYGALLKRSCLTEMLDK